MPSEKEPSTLQKLCGIFQPNSHVLLLIRWLTKSKLHDFKVYKYTCQLFLNPMRENFSDIGRLVSRLPGAREKSLGPSAKGLGRALETQDGRQCLSQKQV